MSHEVVRGGCGIGYIGAQRETMQIEIAMVLCAVGAVSVNLTD
jgi:hypothetical protein